MAEACRNGLISLSMMEIGTMVSCKERVLICGQMAGDIVDNGLTVICMATGSILGRTAGGTMASINMIKSMGRALTDGQMEESIKVDG